MISATQAHEFSTANLTLKQTADDRHEGYLAIALSDLQQTLNLDPTHDGNLTWADLKSSHPKVINYFQKSADFNSSDESCDVSWGSDISLQDSYGETLLKQPVTITCSQPITVHYTAFFNTTSDHKLLINWELTEGQTQAIIQSPEQPFAVSTSSQSAWDTFLFYLYQGMIHIWIGLDHVLFVLTLLLHFVNKPASQNTSTLKTANAFNLKSMVWLVTGFTIAHSITLTLTALDWISVSSKWAEVGIAISVAYSALNVVTHWIKRLMLMTVAFGLLHGLGFAGALSELGLCKSHQLTSIIGFNLGVEIGQIAIILAALPVLWLLKAKESLRKFVVPASSLAIFALGMFWVWERI
ncbi:HupE/UreJ family protein [Kangiella marina]